MDPSYRFTVISTYLTLYNLKVRPNKKEIFKRLWQIKIPNKVFFMIWRVLHDKLPIRINLHKRQIQFLEDGLTCGLCWQSDTDNGNGINYWKSKRYHTIYLVITFIKFHIAYKGENWWIVGWSSIVWILWHQRNNIIFEEQVLLENNFMV